MDDIWFTLDNHGWLLVSYDGGDTWYYSDPQFWGDINLSSYKPGEPSGPEIPPSANYIPANYTPIVYTGGGNGGGGGNPMYPGYPTKYHEIQNDINASVVPFTERIKDYLDEIIFAISDAIDKAPQDARDYTEKLKVASTLFAVFLYGANNETSGIDGILTMK